MLGRYSAKLVVGANTNDGAHPAVTQLAGDGERALLCRDPTCLKPMDMRRCLAAISLFTAWVISLRGLGENKK
jgi:hypothetical protein